MNSKEKRSSGGYGLRRKVAKKRLDEDFEYYSAGAGPQVETSSSNAHLLVVTKLVSPQDKPILKDTECFEKRPRGRPRKHQKDALDPSSSSAEIRGKNPNSSKVAENNKMDKRKEGNLVSAAQEIRIEHLVQVPQDVKVEHMETIEAKRLDILTADGMTELQEEEVSSLPEGEKENLPEDGIHLVAEPDIEEKINMESEEQAEEYDQDLIYEEYDKIAKGPSVFVMKRKRENLSNADIHKLNQLNPDDKIECSECHKLLKPSSFRQHLRTHTGEKPFGCEVCEARFTRKGDVERHVRIVHNKQKPFKCSRCQRAFGDKKNLRWHLMNHDKKLFYVCEVCGFKFGKREYWENHVRFIHPSKGALDLDGDSSTQMEDESEDNLQSLTASLLGGDEASENTTVQTLILRSVQEKKPETVVPAVPLPLLNQLSEQQGIKVINIKNISNLVKLNFSKKQDNARVFGQGVSTGEQGGVEAVVIEVDEPSAGSSTIHPQYTEQAPSNVIHIVNPSDILLDTDMEKNEQQDSKEDTITQDNQEQKVSEDRSSANSIHYVCDESAEPSKMFSFVLTENSASASDGNSASVHTLIDAVLVAAKGDGQQKDAQPT